MRPFSTQSGIGGHPPGGPRCLAGAQTPAARRRGRRRAATLALLLGAVTIGACSGARGPERPRPSRSEPLSRPLEIYRDLGFLTGPGQFPVVASFSTMAGPADSTYVVVGLSMPNSALRFQREGTGFFAEYNVELTFMDPDSVAVKRVRTQETVRIQSFAETGRTDESVVFQHGVALAPGRYIVQLTAADAHSSRGFRMADTVTAPAYGRAGAHLATPVLVYEAGGRADRTALPQMIVNPRHTVPFGGETPLLYIEAYGGNDPVAVQVVSDAGALVWSGTAALHEGEDALRYAVLPIPAETFPLGRFWIDVSSAGATGRRPLVLTISDQWMVANFDEVLQFLRYIAFPQELDSLKTGTPTERRERWERFWERRDPLPVTPLNEYRDEFFQRVRYATEAFREPGRAGWQTDRGEVYIVLGPPDAAMQRYIGRNEMSGLPNGEEWIYGAAAGSRLNLLFHDRTGFGRFELIPSSAAAFRSAADRIKAATAPRD
jgi:GWxTD domain-containing protein